MPKLNFEDSMKFVKKIEKEAKETVGPVPTPKLEEALNVLFSLRKLTVSSRERMLIMAGLYVLECQVVAEEMHSELESELMPITADEVRTLMEKIKLL